MEKQYRKVTTEKLMSLNARLKQELKVESLKLKKRKRSRNIDTSTECSEYHPKRSIDQ